MFTGWKPNVELSPACPRCGSANTKFCYYNNYSLTQPRYFCKGCRRYWTKGGSLRNVPIGGGCRKSRRGKSSIRVSTDGGVGSRNGIESNGSISISTSGGGHDRASTGSIDLAAVYANFLNQTTPRHDNSNDNRNVNEGVSVSHEPDGIVNNNSNIVPVMEFSGFQGFHMNSHLNSHIPQEISHGFFDYGQFNSRLSETSTPLLGSGNSMFFGGPDGFCEKTGNGLISTSNIIINPVEKAIILPPLPGEDVAPPSDQAGILWPDSDVILQNQNDLLRSNDHETQAGQNSEVLDGNLNMMSPFTALNNLEAIFRSC